MVEHEKPDGFRSARGRRPARRHSYRLLGYVAQGAMGEIVEAEHVALRRKVIVKLLRRAYASHPGFLDRLRLEAQTLATSRLARPTSWPCRTSGRPGRPPVPRPRVAPGPDPQGGAPRAARAPARGGRGAREAAPRSARVRARGRDLSTAT